MAKQTPPTSSSIIAIDRARLVQGTWCICISPMVSFHLVAFPSAEMMNNKVIRHRPNTNNACIFTLAPTTEWHSVSITLLNSASTLVDGISQGIASRQSDYGCVASGGGQLDLPQP